MSTRHSFRIIHKPETGSTMEDARQIVLSGSGGNIVCTAARQIRGRGRVPGRVWVDDGKSDLLFTVIVSRNRVTAGYPMTQLMALALCLHLEQSHGLQPRIKWPNDVHVGAGKISGILVETEGTYFLGGMGLNLHRREYPTDLRGPATDLAGELGLADLPGAILPDATRELEGILAELERLLAAPPPISEVTGRLAGLGQPVKVFLGDPSRMETVEGIVAGLQDDGALIVDTGETGFLPVYSGEIA